MNVLYCFGVSLGYSGNFNNFVLVLSLDKITSWTSLDVILSMNYFCHQRCICRKVNWTWILVTFKGTQQSEHSSILLTGNKLRLRLMLNGPLDNLYGLMWTIKIFRETQSDLPKDDQRGIRWYHWYHLEWIRSWRYLTEFFLIQGTTNTS